MENGPVPSAIYDMMKVAAGRRSIDVDWDEIIQEALEVRHGREIVARRDCDMDMLAESEVECIDKTIAEYGSKTFGQLTDITLTVPGMPRMRTSPSRSWRTNAACPPWTGSDGDPR